MSETPVPMRVNRSTLAKAMGVTPGAVTKAVNEGRVTPDADGLFVLADAIDEWFKKTDNAQNRGRKPSMLMEKVRAREKEELETVDSALEASDSDEPAERDDGAMRPDEIRRRLKAGEALTFGEARTANEILKARAADIKLDEMEGRVIPTAEAQALWEAHSIALRDRLRAIPMAVIERLVDGVKQGSSTPVLARLLLAEIDAALEDAASVEVVVEAPDAGSAVAEGARGARRRGSGAPPAA